VCNLYSVTTPQEAMRRAFRITHDLSGNLPPLPAIFPDQMAPVIRPNDAAAGRGRTLDLMRWGFPPPPTAGKQPITNARNLTSPYWRPWLTTATRCLVPVTAFCEYTDQSPKVPHWFALGDARPVFAFAGLWRRWTGVRKGEQREHHLFAIVTTAANDIVQPIHAKAMPVILCFDTWDRWLDGAPAEALALQQPYGGDDLRIVAMGVRQDGQAAHGGPAGPTIDGPAERD